MSYVGNQPATSFSSVSYQDLTGQNGTSFTLDFPVGNANEIAVFVNNVRQEPGVAYTANGTELVTTGSISISDDFYVVFNNKGQQTVSPPVDSVGSAELNAYEVECLVVGGGGGGGGCGQATGLAGGGGAGGFIDSKFVAISLRDYTITIGSGGAGGAAPGGSGTRNGNVGSDGGATEIKTSTGIMFKAFGGGGGSPGRDTNVVGVLGASGGGGGGGGGGSGQTPGGNEIETLPVQGNAGGTGATANGYGAGGGGGSRTAGVDGTTSVGGNGGDGIDWKGLGTSYAGGGGGGAAITGSTPGTGQGGGGNGGSRSAAPTDATANRGAGGGGSGDDDAGTDGGGDGSAGIVIIRYLGTQRGTGGTVTSTGGYTYHTFTSSGTFKG